MKSMCKHLPMKCKFDSYTLNEKLSKPKHLSTYTLNLFAVAWWILKNRRSTNCLLVQAIIILKSASFPMPWNKVLWLLSNHMRVAKCCKFVTFTYWLIKSSNLSIEVSICWKSPYKHLLISQQAMMIEKCYLLRYVDNT